MKNYIYDPEGSSYSWEEKIDWTPLIIATTTAIILGLTFLIITV